MLRVQMRVGEQPSKTEGKRMEHNTVLIVEDDEAIRESLQYFLEDEGYAVVTARDGLAALELKRSKLKHGGMDHEAAKCAICRYSA
jgi:response regulator RpfG family c-di-GMP phosphodiesterase